MVGKNKTKNGANKPHTSKNITQNYNDWQGGSKQLEQTYNLRLLSAEKKNPSNGFTKAIWSVEGLKQ